MSEMMVEKQVWTPEADTAAKLRLVRSYVEQLRGGSDENVTIRGAWTFIRNKPKRLVVHSPSSERVAITVSAIQEIDGRATLRGLKQTNLDMSNGHYLYSEGADEEPELGDFVAEATANGAVSQDLLVIIDQLRCVVTGDSFQADGAEVVGDFSK